MSVNKKFIRHGHCSAVHINHRSLSSMVISINNVEVFLAHNINGIFIDFLLFYFNIPS
jgi:hypothetical protein